MSHTRFDWTTYHDQAAARLCLCDGCGATRERPVKGDGWTVMMTETHSFSDVLCDRCTTERLFSDSIQDSGILFFKALFSAVHPNLRRTAYDALQCAISNSKPASFPEFREFDTLTQYALFESSSREGKS